MEAIDALPTDENGKLITVHNYQKSLSKYIVYLRDWLAVDVVQKEEKHKKETYALAVYSYEKSKRLEETMKAQDKKIQEHSKKLQEQDKQIQEMKVTLAKFVAEQQKKDDGTN